MSELSRLMTFAGNPLDRAHLKRLDGAWLAAALKDEKAKILPLSQGKVLIWETRQKEMRLAWLSPAELRGIDAPTLFLGIEGEIPHFALDLGLRAGPFAEFGSFVDLRLALSTLPPAEAAMAGEARSMLLWHERHRFCANCGAASESVDAGWKRRCGACEAEHFPRTDPVVIMLATRGDEVLLGRKSIFPPGWFTALAGFVEPGETIEEAVAREVLEEAGIRVGAVRYLASQPWPYPSQLMIGCTAEALSTDITIDPTELEDARWFTREEIRVALAHGDKPLKMPPPFAIAHHLIKLWAAEG
jgi:NAD+ diphosphatase